MALPRPVIAGNWKMHLGPEEALRFFERFLEAYPARDDRSVAFFPPALSLSAAQRALQGRDDVLLGVQNVHWEEKGAFTGEISAPLAAAAGARLALVGHSERRQLFGETSEDTARKTRAVLAAGLIPVLCVGETLDQRESGAAAEVTRGQLEVACRDLSEEQAARVLIAYEPVWAIGTGKTASPADAEQMHGEIRRFLQTRYSAALAGSVPILYGGSVKPDNADALLAAGDVDGLLVGGASLDPDGFARVCSARA